MSKRTDIQVGDEVRYAARWLRSTGQYTGRSPVIRGKVTHIDCVPLMSETAVRVICVDWEDGFSSHVLETNLEYRRPGGTWRNEEV